MEEINTIYGGQFVLVLQLKPKNKPYSFRYEALETVWRKIETEATYFPGQVAYLEAASTNDFRENILRLHLAAVVRDVARVVVIHFASQKEKVAFLEGYIPQFKWIEAAGGLVRNQQEETLLIFRQKKWDLPKGKIEADESPEAAAIREVEEETGVQPAEVLRKLADSYHVYKQKEKWYIKKTHWYEMEATESGFFQPQLEEGITKVEWHALRQTGFDLSPTFPLIKQVLINANSGD